MLTDTARPRIGLLPHYLKLYDDTAPKTREAFEPLLAQVEAGLADRGVEVRRAPICRLSDEFADAVATLEPRADLLVSLHLAYSPSGESIAALTRTRLPLLLLDTTMDHDFGPGTDPARLMFNHGIHGVQDLACMLRRHGRAFEIVAGHVSESDVLDRAADLARAALAARRLRACRALRIGPAFRGMGDFAVTESALQRLGVAVTQIAPADLADAVAEVTDAMIEAELAEDRERFDVQADEQVHRRSVRLGLGLRRFLDAGAFDALSANFQAFDQADGPIDTVPFLEISKAMARGVGYAGEGDVLTAGVVGALIAGFERATFTEIFCPDWKGDSLFLSHMGEINPAVAAGRPALLEKQFPYTPAHNPAFLAAAIAPGPAVFVNLAPGPDDTLPLPLGEGRGEGIPFRLIAAPVDVLGDGAAASDSPRSGTHPDWGRAIRAWIRPACPVAEFLERFSRLGGTHHSALVLGDRLEAIAAFARFSGIECRVIGVRTHQEDGQ